MKKHVTAVVLLTPLFLSINGCDALRGLAGTLQPSRMTRVELRNNGDFPVDVTLFYDDDQDILDGIIQETGNERTFQIAAQSTETFSRECDDLQAIIIDGADLRLIGQVGPETDTDVLRDGDDFGCGDTIIFTFDHSELILDFDVTTSVNAG